MLPSDSEINAKTSPEGIGFLQRPRKRIKRDTKPKTIFSLETRNYKLYASIGVTSHSTKRLVTVLDNGATYGFIKTGELQLRLRKKMQVLIDDVNVSSASGKPVSVCGTINFLDKVGKITKAVRFYAVENLATAVILRWDFCDKYVDTIRPRLKIVHMNNGNTVLIAQKPFESQHHTTASREAALQQAE